MPSITSNQALAYFENLFKKPKNEGFFERIFKKLEVIPSICNMCGKDICDPKQRPRHRKSCRYYHILLFSKYLTSSRIDEMKLINSTDTKLLDSLCDDLIRLNFSLEKVNNKFQGKNNQSLEKALNINISDFEFIKPLTKGGYGQIFLVKHIFSQKSMIAKVLSISEAIQRECLGSYVSERELLLNCNSDYILSILYSFRSEFFVYEILEYMESGDLSSHLEIAKVFPENTVRSILAQIFLAMKELKHKRIVHGDIKLENILYSADKKLVKLADFGLAFEEDETLKSAHGTPEYMAPEQILESKKGFESDMWAVGICAYEMLFGIPPYYAEIASNILYKIVHDKKINWDGIEVSNEVKDLISKLLDKNMHTRLNLEEAMNHDFFASIDWTNPPQIKITDYIDIFEERNKRYSSLQFYNINTISTETVAFEEGVFNQNTSIENQIYLLKLFPIKNLNNIFQ